MIAFLILLLVCAALAEEVSCRLAVRGLSYSCLPSRRVVDPGEPFELITVIKNDKWLPLSYLNASQSLPSEIQVDAALEQERFHQEMASARLESSCYLGPRQKLTRRLAAALPHRGRYFIQNARLTAGDLLGLRTVPTDALQFCEMVVLPAPIDAPDIRNALGGFLGDVSVSRFIFEDPVLTAGVREYTGREPMKTIDWKQSARLSRLMAKKFDYTVDNSITVILNVQQAEHDPALLELCFSLARMAVEQLEQLGIPYRFLTNATTAGSMGLWDEVAEGLGTGHADAILEGLGRATYSATESAETLIDRALSRAERGRAHLFITSLEKDGEAAFLRPLRENADGRLFTMAAESAAREIADAQEVTP